jgi:pyruvate dehydrogenase E2 component (dihydrolipoamide acetyltransferase)
LPVAASPTVRRIAAQLGLDLAEVPASGRGGRVELEDLRAYIEQLKALAAAGTESGAPKARPRPRVDFSQFGPILKQPLSPLRQTLGRRMRESWTTVPRVTQFDEVDITELTQLRKRHAPAYERQGAKLTLTVFAIKAAVAALQKHPVLNASLDEEAEEIVLKQYYHIGIAVHTEHGLLVPVLRDADKKSWLDIARELEELAAKARQRKLTGEEMTGGSFTISNQGGIGGAHFTPIVNLPEAAILGLGRGVLKPAVVEGRVEPRWLLPVAISYDHRLIDGGTAARFAVDLAAAFQSFTDKDVAI